MNIATQLELLQLKLDRARLIDAKCTEDSLVVELEDGRTISAPIGWFPRLMHGTQSEREHLIILPTGIHWPDLDEDISVKTLLLGPGIMESSTSHATWERIKDKNKQVVVNGH